MIWYDLIVLEFLKRAFCDMIRFKVFLCHGHYTIWACPSLRYPWNSMDSTAISKEYSDSISMEAMANYAMASIECHGRGGILHNSMEVLELDLVEN